MILGIDVSHWQHIINFELLKSVGIEFCICKATQGDYAVDGTFTRHLSGAKGAGMIGGAYHWADPMRPDEAQADLFLEVIRGRPVDFAMVDVEQFWQDWAEYRAKNVTKFISPERINQNAKAVISRVNKTISPTVLYSRYSFIVDHARGMLEWIRDWPMNWAQYPRAGDRVSVEWADFIANYLPAVEKLKLPPGVKDWHFWQFTGDKFLLPGVYDAYGKPSALDVIYFNGTCEELVQFCGGTIEIDPSEGPAGPAPGLRMRVNVPRLNIRSGPGTWYPDIGDLLVDEIVEVLNVAGDEAWVEIAPGQWACVQKELTQYLVKIEG